jgi:hypothetical protein
MRRTPRRPIPRRCWPRRPRAKIDPEALLAKKAEGKESKLSYTGNLLVENRNGLIVDAEVFQANGTAERDAALVMLEKLPGRQSVTVGGDKGFDTRDFVKECRNLRVTPHVAQIMRGLAVVRIVFSQPKHSSIRFRFLWLTA